MEQKRVISMKPGSTATITLNENPTTGYTWTTSLIPDGLFITKGPYQQGTNCQGRVGCPGTITFKVEADPRLKTGTNLDIEFIYARAWEKNYDNATIQPVTFSII